MAVFINLNLALEAWMMVVWWGVRVVMDKRKSGQETKPLSYTAWVSLVDLHGYVATPSLRLNHSNAS